MRSIDLSTFQKIKKFKMAENIDFLPLLIPFKTFNHHEIWRIYMHQTEVYMKVGDFNPRNSLGIKILAKMETFQKM